MIPVRINQKGVDSKCEEENQRRSKNIIHMKIENTLNSYTQEPATKENNYANKEKSIIFPSPSGANPQQGVPSESNLSFNS